MNFCTPETKAKLISFHSFINLCLLSFSSHTSVYWSELEHGSFIQGLVQHYESMGAFACLNFSFGQ